MSENGPHFGYEAPAAECWSKNGLTSVVCAANTSAYSRANAASCDVVNTYAHNVHPRCGREWAGPIATRCKGGVRCANGQVNTMGGHGWKGNTKARKRLCLEKAMRTTMRTSTEGEALVMLVNSWQPRNDSIPYAQKVRGLEVRIRCYEPASRTVLQLTVRESFD